MNKIIIDGVNFDRLNNGLRPLTELSPKLYELSQKEAERAAVAGKLITPAFKGVNKNTVLLATHIVGKTTIKEFVFASESKNIYVFYYCIDN